jgi:hypothetical protein
VLDLPLARPQVPVGIRIDWRAERNGEHAKNGNRGNESR